MVQPGAVSRRHYRVEMELAERCVDTVYTSVVVDRERLIIGHPAEGGLRIIRTRGERLCKVKDLLEKVPASQWPRWRC